MTTPTPTTPTTPTPTTPASQPPTSTTEATRERVEDLAGRAKQHAQSLVQDLGGLMRRHPFATVAVGLGVGYVLARLLHRR